MADLANRENRSPLSDILGFDPFRNFYPGVAQYHGLEVIKSENGFTVEIPVAGYKPDQINVTLDQNVLTISGKSAKRQFTRSLLLPEEIDPETIAANVEDGLLTLGLSYHPKAQPRKINVNFGTRNVTQ
ncbi:MAG: Hsp20/alpha crystallin family protein [Candidatus Eremiobacteraeota bacterium]|nr:Hsp20/alpha crystallin family protein [Candidatus Eremiobacteraeota bacterium]